jgi:phosphoribosylanthranilate isomerase
MVDAGANGGFIFSDNGSRRRVQSDGISIIRESSSRNLNRVGVVRHVDMNVSDIVVRSDGHGDGVKDVVKRPRHDEFFASMHAVSSFTVWMQLQHVLSPVLRTKNVGVAARNVD